MSVTGESGTEEAGAERAELSDAVANDGWHLAQLNVGVAVGPLDQPPLTEFMANLDEINALAESTPGFVWRLVDDTNNATSFRIADLGDDVLINMSVWKSIDSLRAFTYESAHVPFLRRRTEWFEKPTAPHLVLWWIPAGHTPTLEEAGERLGHLADHGPSAQAFTFAKRFDPPAVD